MPSALFKALSCHGTPIIWSTPVGILVFLLNSITITFNFPLLPHKTLDTGRHLPVLVGLRWLIRKERGKLLDDPERQTIGFSFGLLSSWITIPGIPNWRVRSLFYRLLPLRYTSPYRLDPVSILSNNMTFIKKTPYR